MGEIEQYGNDDEIKDYLYINIISMYEPLQFLIYLRFDSVKILIESACVLKSKLKFQLSFLASHLVYISH